MLYPGIVSGNNHPIGTRLQGFFHHMLHHGLAMDIRQRLARQAG